MVEIMSMVQIALESVEEENDKCRALHFLLKALSELRKASLAALKNIFFLVSVRLRYK